MFLAIPAKPEHMKDVFYLGLHLAMHMDFAAAVTISIAELEQYFKDKLFNSFVICCTNSNYNRPLGCLVFSEDYSFYRGHGFYIDTYYVIEGLRNQKLGHLMMSRLCDEVRIKNYDYIKLYFVKGEQLKTLYNRMGFCNETMYDKRINLIELYGRELVENFLTAKPHPSTCLLDTEVIISSVSSSIGKSNACIINVYETLTCKFAGFTEQITFCGWLGMILLYKDFVGSTNIIDVNLFKSRIRERQTNGPQPLGMWFEIPESHETLIKNLESYGLRNITKLEGWQVAYMYRQGTNDFSYFLHAFPAKRSIKCGTLDKMDVWYRHIYFC